MQRTRLPEGMGVACAKQHLATAGGWTARACGSVAGAAVGAHGAEQAGIHLECARRDQAGLQEEDDAGEGAMRQAKGARRTAPGVSAGRSEAARARGALSKAMPRAGIEPPMPQAAMRRGGKVLLHWR